MSRAWKLDPVLKQKNFDTNRIRFSKGPSNGMKRKPYFLEARVGIVPKLGLQNT
jgi:hypothetical protein